MASASAATARPPVRRAGRARRARTLLIGQQAGDHGEHQVRALTDQAEVERHADGGEEQAEQQALEGGDNCHSQAAVCAHVAAAVIALHHAPQAGHDKPALRTTAGHLRYCFTRSKGTGV